VALPKLLHEQTGFTEMISTLAVVLATVIIAASAVVVVLCIAGMCSVEAFGSVIDHLVPVVVVALVAAGSLARMLERSGRVL
jgi:hypothetical protein